MTADTPPRWRPIAEAPTDGTRVLVFCPWDKAVTTARWEPNYYHDMAPSWSTDDGESVLLAHDPPTHWMPLPAPPEDDGDA